MAGPVNGLASADVRRHNLTLMLRHLASAGPCSRSDLAEQTGLKRGSITPLVQILQDAGLVRETTSVVGARGRPRTNLQLTGEQFGLLVVQIGAEWVTGVLSTLGGAEIARAEASHGAPFGDPGAVIDVAADVAASLRASAERAGCTVADVTVITQSPVGGDPARVLGDAHLGWASVDVLAELTSRVPALGGIPALLSSDAPLAALAELRRLGAPDDAIYIKADDRTIGGALVVDGRIVDGAHGFGGSLGHLAVVPDGRLCACGQHGCLVTVAGVDADPGEGDAWVARTLGILCMAVDPSVIVVGGRWADRAESIASAFESNRPLVAWTDGRRIPVVPGVLGAEAALIGGTEAAQHRVLADPEKFFS